MCKNYEHYFRSSHNGKTNLILIQVNQGWLSDKSLQPHSP